MEDAASDGKIRIVSSAIMLNEAFKLQEDATDEEIGQLTNYFLREFFEVVPVTLSLAAYAANLRRSTEYNLDPWDAIHLSTAILQNIEYFITTDGEGPKNKTPLLPLTDRFHLLANSSCPKLKIVSPPDFQSILDKDMFGAPFEG